MTIISIIIRWIIIKKDSMFIKVLELISEYTGIAFIILFAVIAAAAALRVVIKMRRGEKVTITPVGIANDLPDSITGMNKYDDALETDHRDV